MAPNEKNVILRFAWIGLGAMLILSVSLIVSSDSALADQDGDYDFVLTGPSEVSIVGYHGGGGDIAIPSTVGGLPVTAIGPWAFYSCWSLTSVSIPNGVTSIGACSFTSCGQLRSVIVPATVTSIGICAFQSCTSLSSITFLGLEVPQTSTNWVYADMNAIGHAFNNSNFPGPGGVFDGLPMGATITDGALLGDDSSFSIMWWLSAVVVIVAVILGTKFLLSGLMQRRSTAPLNLPPSQPGRNKSIAKDQPSTPSNNTTQPPPINDRVAKKGPNDQMNRECPWCGAKTMDSTFCRFCGGKLQG